MRGASVGRFGLAGLGVGLFGALGLGGALIAAPAVAGEAQLSLSVPGGSPAQFVVGQTVTIDVQLTGLMPGDSVAFLAATVPLDPSQFGPATITPGSAVPDPTDFFDTSVPGIADGAFDALNGPAITTNATFFSITTQVLDSEGAGQIDFSFANVIGTDAQGQPLRLSTPAEPLGYEVTAIPSPTAALLGFAVGGLVITRRRRRIDSNAS